MTQALCFHCGAIKFGALCPCGTCHKGPLGRLDLDLAFTDHFFHVSTLRQFGAIIRMIQKHTTDPGLAFWTFIHYVEQRTHLLHAEIPTPYRGAIDLLASLKLPDVELNDPHGKPKSFDAQLLSQMKARSQRPPSASVAPQPTDESLAPVLVESRGAVDFMVLQVKAKPDAFMAIARPMDYKITPADLVWLAEKLKAKGLEPRVMALSKDEVFEVRPKTKGCGAVVAALMVLTLAIQIILNV